MKISWILWLVEHRIKNYISIDFIVSFIILLLDKINVKEDSGESLRTVLSDMLVGGCANISNAK